MIDKEQVKHIAKLARLQLKEEEVAAYQQDLSQILDYFDILKEVNTENVEPMTHSIHHENIIREDVPQREDPDVILRMMQLVPAMKDGFLKVKEILKRDA
ncbi:Asp-tRNA(Asn)/Glu-tRNA(Gln) amidotransferase subunit GatC [Patescibacteria group bacterium]|nr:Asp-tRNA(Asn)/Glu-tRNA(Gln) amidotransferase subunit GatC [Patescibacteria group bacterium]